VGSALSDDHAPPPPLIPISSFVPRHLRSLEYWFDPTQVSAFASIRRYQKLAYNEARSYVAIP
jgi:hypothetical protein